MKRSDIKAGDEPPYPIDEVTREIADAFNDVERALAEVERKNSTLDAYMAEHRGGWRRDVCRCQSRPSAHGRDDRSGWWGRLTRRLKRG